MRLIRPLGDDILTTSVTLQKGQSTAQITAPHSQQLEKPLLPGSETCTVKKKTYTFNVVTVYTETLVPFMCTSTVQHFDNAHIKIMQAYGIGKNTFSNINFVGFFSDPIVLHTVLISNTRFKRLFGNLDLVSHKAMCNYVNRLAKF